MRRGGGRIDERRTARRAPKTQDRSCCSSVSCAHSTLDEPGAQARDGHAGDDKRDPICCSTLVGM